MESDKYDIIILGSGVSECLLTTILAKEGKKVAQIDSADSPGDDSFSIPIQKLWAKFRPEESISQALVSKSDEWKVDLISKLLFSAGKISKLLLKTHISSNLRFRPIEGVFILWENDNPGNGRPAKELKQVPTSLQDVMCCDMLTIHEKRRCQAFLEYVSDLDLQWRVLKQAKVKGLDINTCHFKVLLEKFGLAEKTKDLLGHAMALYGTDEYLNKSSVDTIERIKHYLDSAGRFGSTPFIYPVFGLGGILQSAVNKSTAFDAKCEFGQKIVSIDYGPDGKVSGVTTAKKKYLANIIICNPQVALALELKGKAREIARVVRCVCILDHTISGTNEASSASIILPLKVTGRRGDIYINMVSSIHHVSKPGYYIATVTTLYEPPSHEVLAQKSPQDYYYSYLAPALDLLQPISHKFAWVSPMYEGYSDSPVDNLYITRGVDPTPTFNSLAHEIVWLCRKVGIGEIDLDKLGDIGDEDF
jgi:Rab GDP dissociation inhibitor